LGFWVEAPAFMAGVSVSGKIQRFSAGGLFHSQSNMAHAPQAGAPKNLNEPKFAAVICIVF
jgi:hypothetical protein